MRIVIKLFLLILFSSAYVLTAQVITGNLEGRIADSNNSALPNANIIVNSSNLQGTKGGTTNKDGYFRILSLPPGIYKVKISFIGLQSVFFQDVDIRLGKTTNLGKIQLNPQSVTMPELIVSGKSLSTDLSSTSYGGNINSAYFENLPLERNYQNMISLLPQANLSYYGDGVNIAGSTGFENKYFIDGVEVTDPLFGVFSTYLPYNFIKEVEVKAGGYEAEFRSALGGVVNVVTNSGTNTFLASAFSFYTNNNFADHYEKGLRDPTQGNFNDYDVGFSLGGPLLRDKLWFFTAYNPVFYNRDVSIPGFGTYVDRTIRHSFAAKVNWNPLEQFRFSLTAAGDPAKRKAAGRNLLNVPDNLGNPDLYLQNIGEGGFNTAFNGSYSPAENILFDLTIAHVIRHDTGEPLTKKGEEPVYNDWIDNFFEGGVGIAWDSYRFSSISKLTGTALINDHILTAGVEYKINGLDEQYNWHSINKAITGDGKTFWGEYFGRRDVPARERLPSVFIQDSWKISQYIKFTGGLRWDGQYLFVNGKKMQSVKFPLQPRAGLIVIPDREGKNRFSGSYGRYSQELALGTIAGIFSNNGYDSVFVYYNDPRIPGTIPDSSNAFPILISPEVEDLYGQYFDEFSIGYERNVTKTLRINIQGVYRRLGEAIDHAFSRIVMDFRLGNPGRDLMKEFPRPRREYQAIILTLEQHHNEKFNFLVSYVLSRNYGNYEGLFDAVGHREFPNDNWIGNNPQYASINTTGLLPNDRTHLFKLSGSYRFSFGLTAGLSFTAQSGTPLSDYADIGSIVLLSERGSVGRTPAVWDLNVRFLYEIPTQYFNNARLIIDIFHIASQFKPVDINQAHYFGLDEEGNPEFPNPFYGKAYRYQQPMSIRFGLEISL